MVDLHTMKNFFSTLLFAALLALSTQSVAQKSDSSLIQFSGVVLDADSLIPIPFAAIIIKNSYRGTTSDYYGYFSFVAEVGDTIEFSSIGFRKEVYIIPDTLTTNRYSLIQLMNSDTFLLPEVEVYPWPSKSEFREAFLNLNLNRTDYDRAFANLDKRAMRQAALNMPMADGSANFKYSQINRNSQLYYAGQYPSWTILNPIAWAKFIDSWKQGDFKNDQ